ncbi:hypothetical protein P4O66_009672, partial [Electrophorus voltai]
MPKDVVRYVTSCLDFACSKTPRVPLAGKLLPLPTLHRPWSHLAVDFVTDLPASEGNTAVLSIIDRFSKMVRDVETQNSLRHAGTGFTPFECVLGYQPPLYPWNVPTSDQPEVERWCRESKRTWEETHQNLHLGDHRLQEEGRQEKYEIGQKVWVSTRDGRAGATGKLEARYKGPYSVTGQVNEVTYRVDLAGSSRASWAFHVSSLKPMREGPLPPPPLETEEGLTYRVCSLLDSLRRGQGLQYLVDWEGYGPEECCWVPASQILDLDLIALFHRRLPLRSAPSRRGQSWAGGWSGPWGGRGGFLSWQTGAQKGETRPRRTRTMSCTFLDHNHLSSDRRHLHLINLHLYLYTH